MVKINYPIIDRTVTAFPCLFKENKDTLRVYFYFQSLDKDFNINTKYILAKVLLEGRSAFNGDQSSYEPFTVSLDAENLLDSNRYYIDIPSSVIRGQKFTINSVLFVQLMALSDSITGFNDNFFHILQNRIWDRSWKYYESHDWAEDLLAAQEDNPSVHYVSQWSEPVYFYPIAKPNFLTYGGLFESEIVDKNALTPDNQEIKLLQENAFDQSFNTANQYIFKSVLGIDSDVDQSIELENDILYSYEVKLIGYRSTTDTRALTIGSQSYQVYPTRIQIESTNGEAYLDTDWDPSRKSFYHRLKYDFTKGTFQQYELVVIYHTQKGYTAQHSYFLSPQTVEEEQETIDDNLYISYLNYSAEPSKGCVAIEVQFKYTDQGPSFLRTGTLTIERAVDLYYGVQEPGYELVWETIYSQALSLNLSSATGHTSELIKIDDMTAEPGTLYQYRVRFKYWNNATQSMVFAQEAQNDNRVMLMIEDSFLATRDLTLKIRYNPELNTYKRNVVDVITPTLGGAYPFARRNGAQRYRTFTIGGLISYNAEKYEPNDWEVDSNYQPVFLPDDLATNEFYNSLFINSNGKNKIDSVYYSNLVNQGLISPEDKRIIYEKKFRDMVIDFLYKDQVILFKSQSEGNIFVRLSNIQFTPNKQLARHIYSFTATATEVLEANSENYCAQFSPEEEVEVANTWNVYLVASYYDYDQNTLYVGEGNRKGSVDVNTNYQSTVWEADWSGEDTDSEPAIHLHLQTDNGATVKGE